MSTRLPSITKPKLSKVFASALAVCAFCTSSLSHADTVSYRDLPVSVQKKIEEPHYFLSENNCQIRYSDRVSISGICINQNLVNIPFWGYDHLDLNALKQKVDDITLNVGRFKFDRYSVGRSSRYPGLNTLYLDHGLLPTVYFDGKVYEELMGGNTLSIDKEATVVGQRSNDFLQQTRFNRPLVAVEAYSSSIKSEGTIRASEDMLEVPAEKFQMFELNDFYSVKLHDSGLDNSGVIQGTIFANDSYINNAGEIYGSPKDGRLVALTAQHSSINLSGRVYGDLVLNWTYSKDSSNLHAYSSLLGSHVGNVYLNAAAPYSFHVSVDVKLNGEVYAPDYAIVLVYGFKHPTKQIKVPTVKPQPLFETYKEFERAETIEGTYSKYYLSNLVPSDKKNLPGKVTKTKNPTGTLFIGGVLSLNDFSLDTSDEAIFYGVQRVMPYDFGLIVYGLPENSVSTFLFVDNNYKPLYFEDLGTCGVPGVLYDYDRLKQMHALKIAGKLEINTDCYGRFDSRIVPEHLKDILEWKPKS